MYYVILNARVKKSLGFFLGRREAATTISQGANCTDISVPEMFDTEGESYYAITRFALSLLSQPVKRNIFCTSSEYHFCELGRWLLHCIYFLPVKTHQTS